MMFFNILGNKRNNILLAPMRWQSLHRNGLIKVAYKRTHQNLFEKAEADKNKQQKDKKLMAQRQREFPE